METIAIALGLVALTAIVTAATVRRPMRRLALETQRLVRDPSRRISMISGDADLKELGHWINALAEDSERSRDALHHERTLLASVADGLTQGVIAKIGRAHV